MMQRKKIKLLITNLLLFLALSITVFSVLMPNHKTALNAGIKINANTEIKSQSSHEGDIEQIDKPAYFNIFKLIFSFLPVNSNQD
ncbi:MAG: hypothetical protein WCR21_00995 [Bacteroidota bacterium]